MHYVCNYKHKLYFHELHHKGFQNHAQKFQKHLRKGEKDIIISPLQTNSGSEGNQLVIQTMFKVGSHPFAHSMSGEIHHSNPPRAPQASQGTPCGLRRGSEQQGFDRSTVHQQNLFKLLTLLPMSGENLFWLGKKNKQVMDGHLTALPFASKAFNTFSGAREERGALPYSSSHTGRSG